MDLLAGLAVLAVWAALEGFGVPIACNLITMWAWAYTIVLPTDIGSRRRQELQSDLWEQTVDEHKRGYSRQAIALRLLVRSMLGAPADLGWAAGVARTHASQSLKRITDTVLMLGMTLVLIVMARVALTGRSDGGSPVSDDGRRWTVPFVVLAAIYLVYFGKRLRGPTVATLDPT